MQHDACRLNDADETPAVCDRWLDTTFDRMGDLVEETNASAIVTSSRQPRPGTPFDESTSSFASAYESLGSHGVPLAVIAPVPEGNVVGLDCPSLLFDGLRECAIDRSVGLAHAPPILAAVNEAGAELIEMTQFFCNTSTCPAVIDDIWVRRDSHHISRTYSAALSEALEAEIAKVLPELFDAPGPAVAPGALAFEQSQGQ